MELKLVPVMTRLHPIRDIARAIRFTPMYEGKFSPVVRLFFRIGLHAYESGSVPHDPLALQALLEQESVGESNERLPEIPATSDLGVAGPGLAGKAKYGTAAVRRPRIDPFHVFLGLIYSSLKRNPELERV